MNTKNSSTGSLQDRIDEKIEEILRGQFVDRAYSETGETTWGIFNTRNKIKQALKSEIIEAIEGMRPEKSKERIQEHTSVEVYEMGYDNACLDVKERLEEVLG